MALTALTRWIVAGTVVITGACAPVSEAAIGGTSTSFLNTASAASGDAERTLVFGYGAIYERYLNRVSVSEVALEGMHGFSTIDKQIAVRQQGNSVRVLNADKPVAEYTAPAENDTAGWARLTLAAAAAARQASPEMGKADDDRVLKAVFDSSLAKLDPFSRYSSPDEARNHRANRNGFAGIGVRYEKVGEQGVEINSVIPESPAENAGLRDGDVLTQIDGRPVTGMDLDQVSAALRGDVGSEVRLTYLRDRSESRIATVRRSVVIPPTVSMALEGGVANIKISGFNQRTAASLGKSLREARAQLGPELKGVLLDLRGNPGGLLDQAVSMADMFMSEGRIVSTQGRHRHASQSYDASPGDIAEDLPLVLLVDGKSASASEILAAALQDSGRAVVVGTNSYGKGTVQTVLRMPNEGEMTLTWSRFHSPTGYALHGLGVLPSICTSEGKERANNLLKAAADGQGGVSANLAMWRSAGVDQTDLRKQLRATCPSEKHGDDPDESRLAEDLLQDKQLYARVLSLSVPSLTEPGRGAQLGGKADTVQAEVKPH